MKKQILFTVIAIIGLATATMAQMPVTDGLVNYWGFNGNANDSIGHKDGVTYNVTLTTDRFGNPNKAYAFNSQTEGYISVSYNNMLLESTYSVCAWYKTVNPSIVNQCIMNSHNSSTLTPTFCMYYHMVNFNYTYFAGSNMSPIGAPSINDTNWHYVVCSYEDYKSKFYVDNVLVDSNESIGAYGIFDILYFGKYQSANTEFNGSLDDIAIYNRVLTQQEITQIYLYNGPTGITTNTKENDFVIYPNPASNNVNVKINTSLIGSQYTITDQLGRNVLTGKLTAETSVIELGNLANGIYLLRVGENIQQTFKVVKE